MTQTGKYGGSSAGYQQGNDQFVEKNLSQPSRAINFTSLFKRTKKEYEDQPGNVW